MRASSLHTLEQTAILLGWSTHTVRSYTKIAGIVPVSSGHYRGRTLYSDADIDLLRRTRAERDPQSGASRAADTSALETRLVALEQQVAALTARLDDNLASPAYSHSYEPSKRLTTSTARESRTPARPPIPPHLMSIPTWAERHGVRLGTIKTWREKGRLPVERGQWLENGVRIDTALTIDGREAAHQLAGIAWPCERCAAVEREKNETPSTYAAVEGAR